MTLKGSNFALNSYHGQLPGFQKTHYINVCTFSKRQLPYSRIRENSMTFWQQFQIYAPPSIRVIRVLEPPTWQSFLASHTIAILVLKRNRSFSCHEHTSTRTQKNSLRTKHINIFSLWPNMSVYTLIRCWEHVVVRLLLCLNALAV